MLVEARFNIMKMSVLLKVIPQAQTDLYPHLLHLSCPCVLLWP